MKAGNKPGKHWKTSDFNNVIMSDKKINESMGFKDSDRSNGVATTNYDKKGS